MLLNKSGGFSAFFPGGPLWQYFAICSFNVFDVPAALFSFLSLALGFGGISISPGLGTTITVVFLHSLGCFFLWLRLLRVLTISEQRNDCLNVFQNGAILFFVIINSLDKRLGFCIKILQTKFHFRHGSDGWQSFR